MSQEKRTQRQGKDKENGGWSEQGTRRNKNSNPGVQQPQLPQPHAWLGKTQEFRPRRSQGQRIHVGVAVDVGSCIL